MCGIAGILNLCPQRAARDEMDRMLTVMLDAMVHRGPDGEGRVVTDEMALGHRRLAILDLSEAGRQPMSNARGDIITAANGEIYNYRDITAKLQAAGYQFQSTCDSEVLVHAYDAYGPQMVQEFNGMWGFAVWDDRKKQFLLSRDRIGVKPLYHTKINDYFLFASEVKALLPFLPRPIKDDQRYLYKMLAKHTFDDCEDTICEQIKMLPQATTATIGLDGQLRIEPFWELDPSAEPIYMSESAAVERFTELFTDSVRLRMISDAPLTFFLSGGMDSGTVVGTATKLAGTGLSSVSTMFQDSEADERRFIYDSIQAYQTIPTIISPEPNGRLLDIMRDVVWMLDGPTCNKANILRWFLCRSVRELLNCKVVLTGNGGDEIFGGYHPYFRNYLNSLMRDYHATRRPAYLMRFALEACRLRMQLGKSFVFNYPESTFGEGWKRTAMQAFRDRLSRGAVKRSRDIPEFLDADFKTEVAERTEAIPRTEFIEEQTCLGLRRTIMPRLLRHEDRMSMAWGLEARQPFLDYRLVEFVTRLDYRLKTRGLKTKYLARQAMKGTMPDSVRNRVDKMGLPSPMARWLRTTERESCRDFLMDAAARHTGVLNRQGTEELFDKHAASKFDATKQIISLLTTAVWLDHRAALDRQGSFWDGDVQPVSIRAA